MPDDKATISELREWINGFNKERDWEKHLLPKDIAIDISNEAAEVLEHMVYKNDEEIEQMLKDAAKREEVEDEAADVLWALLNFSIAAKIDLTSALERKIKKTAMRYPADKVRGSKKKYTEYED
jgi:NTP pyrophosphatase (non-canonical NTP hydrolase)